MKNEQPNESKNMKTGNPFRRTEQRQIDAESAWLNHIAASPLTNHTAQDKQSFLAAWVSEAAIADEAAAKEMERRAKEADSDIPSIVIYPGDEQEIHGGDSEA